MTEEESSLSRYTFVSGSSILIQGEKGKETISRYHPEEIEIKSLRREATEDNGDNGIPPRLQPPQPVSANLSCQSGYGLSSEHGPSIRAIIVERAKRDIKRLARNEALIKDNKYPSCFSCKYPNVSNLCRGKWSNGYLYSDCYNCSLLYIQLCENCSHSKFHGPHLRCRLGDRAGISKTFRGLWIPQSKAIRFDHNNACVTYSRREFENREYYGFR